MNKCKEAKAWIDKINAHTEWTRCDIEEPAISQITELVQKATPKKITFSAGESYAYCPMCNSEFEDAYYGNWKVEYCPYCGQRLDWSEEE